MMSSPALVADQYCYSDLPGTMVASPSLHQLESHSASFVRSPLDSRQTSVPMHPTSVAVNNATEVTTPQAPEKSVVATPEAQGKSVVATPHKSVVATPEAQEKSVVTTPEVKDKYVVATSEGTDKSVVVTPEATAKSVVATPEATEKSVVATPEGTDKSVVATPEATAKSVVATPEATEKSVVVTSEATDKLVVATTGKLVVENPESQGHLADPSVVDDADGGGQEVHTPPIFNTPMSSITDSTSRPAATYIQRDKLNKRQKVGEGDHGHQGNVSADGIAQ